MKNSEVKRLFDVATEIYEDDVLTWEEKYDLIFSDKLSRKVNDLFSYYSDGSYEDDVSAFMSAFKYYIYFESGEERENKKEYYKKKLEE